VSVSRGLGKRGPSWEGNLLCSHWREGLCVEKFHKLRRSNWTRWYDNKPTLAEEVELCLRFYFFPSTFYCKMRFEDLNEKSFVQEMQLQCKRMHLKQISAYKIVKFIFPSIWTGIQSHAMFHVFFSIKILNLGSFSRWSRCLQSPQKRLNP
jgi:hypothetical protein